MSGRSPVVVVVDDSHVQRTVLATEETTVTQQVSHIDLSNANPACGHKDVGRSTGHIMVTTRYSDQQTNRDPNHGKKLCGSTSNGTDQYQNGSSNLLTPYREQPRPTRNVVAYPRPAFSAKNRKNYVPTSFDQQVQVSQGHTLYRSKKN